MLVGCECFAARMQGFRDWVLSQLVSKSVVSPLSGSDSFFSVGRSTNEVLTDQGSTFHLILKDWLFSTLV